MHVLEASKKNWSRKLADFLVNLERNAVRPGGGLPLGSCAYRRGEGFELDKGGGELKFSSERFEEWRRIRDVLAGPFVTPEGVDDVSDFPSVRGRDTGGVAGALLFSRDKKAGYPAAGFREGASYGSDFRLRAGSLRIEGLDGQLIVDVIEEL